MISIENLNFFYNEKHILKNISLHAQKSQLIGILGANGCGKSTLLKNILGFLKPQSGNIFIQQSPISSFNAKELATIMSYIPQKSIVTMPLKVIDFVLAGRYVKLSNPLFGYQQNDLDTVKYTMTMLDIWQYKERIVTTLSGGEFGRMLLARALVSEPQIMILDEPTSAMDLHYAIEILRIVKDLICKLNLCVILVIHDLTLAGLFCDVIAFMKNGEILDFGKPHDLLHAEKLQVVYDGLQCEVVNHNGRRIVIPTV